jgi:DoxX
MQAVRRHDTAVIRHAPAREARAVAPVAANPAYQAFLILRVGFTVAPIIAGLDKFANLLGDWTKYLAPVIPKTLGLAPETFMRGVGVIEIVAGILVAALPRYAAYIVAAWLAAIIVNLLILGAFLDVALRDLGLMLGAIALGRLAQGVHDWKER